MSMSSEHEQLPRQAINLGDTAQIKRVLDEVASQVQCLRTDRVCSFWYPNANVLQDPICLNF